MTDLDENYINQKNEKGNKKLEPLSEDHIAYAKKQLKELHPLEKYRVYEAFPWLGKLACYKKQSDAAVDGDYM